MSRSGMLRAAAAALVVPVLGAAGGCAWSSSLKAREAVVHFVRDTPASTRAAARAACMDFPHVTPEPIATDALSLRAQTDIRYRVDNADDHDLAVLYTCLSQQPGYLTAETIPLGNNNG